MKVSDIAEKLGLKITAGAAGVNKEVNGCYIGDLMSLAMAKVEKGNVWITIQTNQNIVAVSALKEAACVVLAEGSLPDEIAKAKAEDEEIAIFTSDKSVYELAKCLGELGV